MYHLLTDLLPAVIAAGFAALSCGLVLMWARPWLRPMMRAREDHRAVQASHTGDPLRLGGIAILFGVLAGALLAGGLPGGGFAVLLLCSAVPVLAAGLAEDLGHAVSPRGRYGAALVSAVLAVALMGVWVPRADLPLLDALLGLAVVAIPLSIFVAASFCHALNLIDGMNGLAALNVILAAGGLAVISAATALPEIAVLATLLAAAGTGFLLLNWPVGRLFLGDAGSYGMGHLLVWMAFAIIALREDVALAAILMVLFWPIADTVHTIYRRLAKRKPIMEPDKMHLHQKIRRGLEIIWLGNRRRGLSNPLTTLLMAPLIATPVVAGVMLHDQPVAAFLALAGFGAAFGGVHLVIAALARRRVFGRHPMVQRAARHAAGHAEVAGASKSAL